MGSKITLAEICTDISYGYTASATAKPVGPKFLRITDIQGGKVNWENVPYCEIDEKDSLKYLLQDGDIVIARTGNSTGENFIFSSNTKVVFASYLIRFRIDPKKANPKFIWLQMRTPQWWSFIDSVKTGSAQAGANAKVLGLYEVELPERKIQDHIADIGFNLLKKQDINSKINQTLEQMSQTLFKSWFVDFDPVIDNALDAGNPIPEALQTRTKLRQKARNSTDFKPLPAEICSLFPSEFEETELGWVPKGWNISLAGEEFIIKGGSTPSTANVDFWINGTIYWTSPKDLTGNESKVLLDTAKKITPLGLAKISSGLLPIDTVLMSSRAPIGYLALNKVPMAINQGYIAIPSAKHLSPEYTIYWLDNIMDDIKGIAGGTTFAEISKSAFKTIKLLIPSSDIITEFSRVTRNHFDKVVQNTKEIDSLTNLRDTLLPKLISGELSLEDLPDLTTDTEAA
ncbi:TPA: restriction endonuclease subunit S [Escherichia coli]|uniref:restriction endonuclease subunit S n=1 Tax=Escherichia coli TaxID=562 RepID=UPI0007A00012|nr:restriction endonuclease subunit S [Escherichia coli]EEQ3931141.1 restriction endonuclease subunit S [Escherichia coli]EEQ9665451.1 restriction endonuclease subunit S [Escherichia coli]EEW0064278.1 restriction endonuclease subunit S [Escherichia coli]EFA1708476.1 restriction endonuclease subunit S [Escherichia coli]EFC7121056.1 restriction endonuclease subunit S [Escherichia coli]